MDKEFAVVDLASQHALEAPDRRGIQISREGFLIVKPRPAEAGDDFPYKGLQRHVGPAIPGGIF